MNRIYSALLLISIILICPACILSQVQSQRSLTLDHEVYARLENYILSHEVDSVFIMSQPYHLEQMPGQDDLLDIIMRKQVLPSDSLIGLQIMAVPEFSFHSSHFPRHTWGSTIDGVIQIGRLLGVNRLYVSSGLKEDPEFHGDTTKSLAGYLLESYVRLDLDHISLFAGRMPRNFGSPNEYGLLYSNNAYPFDHFGFTAAQGKYQYSFFMGRLNDVWGIDDQGVLIPIGEKEKSKRFFSFQRLDVILTDKLQFGLSAAAMYGGPDETFVAAYANPLNFYYLSQRNQLVQMNGLWQLNALYRFAKGQSIYVDLLVDDFILNNNEEKNDREIYPDRLGILAKYSRVNTVAERDLITLRYVRIWNEAYVTFRNFENWNFYDKGIGFPNRAFQSIGTSYTYLSNIHVLVAVSFELWEQGDRGMKGTFVGDASIAFPAPPVEKGGTFKINYSRRYQYGFEILFELAIARSGVSDAFDQRTNEVNLGLNYNFSI